MIKHRNITLLHMANETASDLKEARERVSEQCTAAKEELKRAEQTVKSYPRYSIVADELRNDALYYEHEIARLTMLIRCAERLADRIESGEIQNAILLTGKEADKEYQGLPDLPEDYLTPEEREQQRQEFEELP
jgi:capsule polysaccharide export protein KpsC/LpsZ